MNKPVLLVLFKRPNFLEAQLSIVFGSNPSKVYVSSDAARPYVSGETEAVNEVRRIIQAYKENGFPIVVKENDINLGCQKSVVTALDWVLDLEEDIIVLEDDLIPDPTFFTFCKDLLDYYSCDERIGLITGYNGLGRYPTKSSYIAAHTGGIWGWATWRRAWVKNETTMDGLGNDFDLQWFIKSLGLILGNIRYKQLLKAKSDIHNGLISSWAFPWAFARHRSQMWALVSSVNLISNIGIGDEVAATHTDSFNQRIPRIRSQQFPLTHPNKLKPSGIYDVLFLKNLKIRSLKGYLIALFRIISGRYK